MSAPRTDRVARTLHWGHAGLLLVLVALGWYMVGLPKGPDKAGLFAVHKSLGLVAALLLILRLAWRQAAGKAATVPAHGISPCHRRLLFGMLFLTPLAGFLSTNFGRHPLRFFALTLPKFGAPDELLSRFFALCHAICVWLLLVLVVLHLASMMGWLRLDRWFAAKSRFADKTLDGRRSVQ